MKSIFEYQFFSIGQYSLTMAQVVGVLVTWVLTIILLNGVKRLINRDSKLVSLADKGRRHSLYLIAKYFFWVIAIAIMMEIVGLRVSVVLAGSAALLVGLSLGIQQIFRDIMSGIFLLFEGTVEVGDIVQMGGKTCKVVEINLRTSKLITTDGIFLIVPNHNLITETVSNWTHKDELPARYSVVFSTDYMADEHVVKTLVLPIVYSYSDIITSDEQLQPSIRLTEFTDERILFELLFWTHRKFESDSLKSDLRFQIRKILRESGIAMAK